MWVAGAFLFTKTISRRKIFCLRRTRDLDFLFPVPFNLKRKTDLFELLKDLGFVLDLKGKQGFITFLHHELTLEFLTHARGRESNKPISIDKLGINAQGLRFMDELRRDPIQMQFGDIKVTIPHPADFALHKLLIANRRKDKDKATKDRTQAVALLKTLNEFDKIETVCTAYHLIPKKGQKTIKEELLDLDEKELFDLIK